MYPSYGEVRSYLRYVLPTSIVSSCGHYLSPLLEWLFHDPIETLSISHIAPNVRDTSMNQLNGGRVITHKNEEPSPIDAQDPNLENITINCLSLLPQNRLPRMSDWSGFYVILS